MTAANAQVADQPTQNGQTAAPAEQTAKPEPADGLQDIVVTAQRREERLQDVPIAVAAVSGERALATGITDTTALNGKIAGLNIVVQGPQNLIFLRGVGSRTAGPAAETSVATYVDGIYIYSGVGNEFPFNAIERIEVLKGPQGTLFGRNATGGLIQIVTKDPSHDPQASISAGYGNYDTFTGSLYATTGLTDDLAINVAVNGQNQGQGFGRDLTRGVDTNFLNFLSARTKLQYKPSDRTKITATFQYELTDGSGNNNKQPDGVRGLDGVARNTGRYDTVADFPESFKVHTYLGALRVEQDVGFASIVSISAYRKVDARLDLDQDATPLPIVNAVLNTPSHNFSQEVQLVGAPDPKLDWVVGAFYFNAYGAYDPLTITGLAAAPFNRLDIFGPQDTRSFSLFGQATYEVLPRTRFTAGLRHTWERQSQNGATISGDGAVIAAIPDMTVKDNDFTWRLSLDHKFSDDILAYVSYNRGLKSGGFNNAAPTRAPYRPEKLDAYEIGLKTTLLDNRLRLNSAAYLYKYDNLQVLFATPGSAYTANAANATIKGVEADFQAVPIAGLTLYGSIGYIDGRFDRYPGAIAYPPSALDGPSVIFDASGKRTVNSPKWSGSLGSTYVIPSNAGEFTLDALLAFSSSAFASPDNRLRLPSYHTVNASLSWKQNNGPFGVRFWVRNLFDESYLSTALPTEIGDTIVAAPPRTFGLTLSADFR